MTYDSNILDTSATDPIYHTARKKGLLNSRFKKRTDVIISAIKRYSQANTEYILDIGCADGLMLSMVKKKFPESGCFGVEYLNDLVRLNSDNKVSVVQANAVALPFPPGKFDVIIASGVIDYLPEPEKMLNEVHTALKADGVFIMTSPDPFWIKVASMLGQLKEGIPGHDYTMSLGKLIYTLQKNHFTMLEVKKFMIPSNLLCNNEALERIVRILKLHFLFVNRILIAKKIKYYSPGNGKDYLCY